MIKTLNLIIHLSKSIFVFAGIGSVLPKTNLNSTKHLPYRAGVFGTFWNVLKHPNTAKFFGQDSETTFVVFLTRITGSSPMTSIYGVNCELVRCDQI